jgi:hypothetical protein
MAFPLRKRWGIENFLKEAIFLKNVSYGDDCIPI